MHRKKSRVANVTAPPRQNKTLCIPSAPGRSHAPGPRTRFSPKFDPYIHARRVLCSRLFCGNRRGQLLLRAALAVPVPLAHLGMNDLGDNGPLDPIRILGRARPLALAWVFSALQLDTGAVVCAVRPAEAARERSGKSLGLLRTGAIGASLRILPFARAVAAARALGTAHDFPDEVRHGHLDVELANVGKGLKVEISGGRTVSLRCSSLPGGDWMEQTRKC